jgi:antitoxin HicB
MVMAREFAYPVTLTPDDTGFVVTFRDIPEAITQGETEIEALLEAADALEEAIAGRIRRGDPIPESSPVMERLVVRVSVPTA